MMKKNRVFLECYNDCVARMKYYDKYYVRYEYL